MGLFTKEQFAGEGDEAGVFWDGLSASLITWTAMQDRTMTVADAAAAFNTSPDVIRSAIEDAMWIGYSGPDDDPTKQPLELDGA